MKFVIFDAEANGLTPDKFHCISYNIGSEVGSFTSYDDMKDFLTSQKVLVGHNIQRWDVPNLERVLNIKISARLIDTLAISWYLFPDRVKHGLESWGEDFGIKKPFIPDWENLSVDDYVNRCNRDVEINVALWQKQWSHLLELYESEEEALRFLSYLEFKMDCAREQEEIGWRLDTLKCSGTLTNLSKERSDKVEELRRAMPSVKVFSVKKPPAKPYKMDGSLSKSGEDWELFCQNRGLNPKETTEVRYVKDYKEPNPNSSEQIKDWLYSLGWKPQTFLYKRDKVTNELTKIPQVAQEKTKGPGLCESVLALLPKEPKLSVLDGLSVLNHRISILKGFLNNSEKSYLKAEIDGLTNTLRFKHRTIVNLPGVQTPYGEDIRGCLIAPEGTVLCGSDMSGLEDRLKQHYIYPYDPQYVMEMLSDDYDPHLGLALSAGAVTQDQVDKYKSGEDKSIKDIRHTYKQGNYAAQYGARPKRIALTLGCSQELATKIYDTYWAKNWAIVKAAENTYVKVCRGDMWLYNPISKFWYSLRCEKDKFSTLVQGSAVFCFDSWVREVRKRYAICGQFHDEVVFPIDKRTPEVEVEKFLKEAVHRVNNKLKLNRELDVDVQFGDNYAEIH